jgi:hypothetical protein
LNIGRCIAIAMTPMIAPTPIIMSGSTIEVRADQGVDLVLVEVGDLVEHRARPSPRRS